MMNITYDLTVGVSFYFSLRLFGKYPCSYERGFYCDKSLSLMVKYAIIPIGC